MRHFQSKHMHVFSKKSSHGVQECLWKPAVVCPDMIWIIVIDFMVCNEFYVLPFSIVMETSHRFPMLPLLKGMS